MKISKTLLQTIALAVTVATVTTGCKKDKPVKPNEETVEQSKGTDNCPACGMG